MSGERRGVPESLDPRFFVARTLAARVGRRFSARSRSSSWGGARASLAGAGFSAGGVGAGAAGAGDGFGAGAGASGFGLHRGFRYAGSPTATSGLTKKKRSMHGGLHTEGPCDTNIVQPEKEPLAAE